MISNETYLPLSRGLKDHLTKMTDSALKAYIFLLINATHYGEKKGTIAISIRDLSKMLNKSYATIYKAIKSLKNKYIEYAPAKNQFDVSIFTILKYKNIKDFAYIKLDTSKNDSKVIASKERGKSEVKATPNIPYHEAKNETPKNDKNVKNGKNGKGASPSPQQKFIKAWGRLYEAETEHPYKATNKDFVLVAGLIKKYSADKVNDKAKILFKFCKERSVWFTKEGMSNFTIGKLSSMWNSLIPCNKPMTKTDRIVDAVNASLKKLEQEKEGVKNE